MRPLLWSLLLVAAPLGAGTPDEIRGSVVHARGGETLANVEVLLVGGVYRTTADGAGHFRISEVAPAIIS